MKVVPVIDLRGGVCVHAKAGERAAYRPLTSVLTAEAQAPEKLIDAYHNHLGSKCVYLADLDAILDDSPHWGTIASLARRGVRLWVDAGVRSAQRAVSLCEAGVETIVLGLESLTGADELHEIVVRSRLPRDRFLLSLDLFDGRPMFAAESRWPAGAGLREIVNEAWGLGLRRYLVLDIARVGTGRGVAGAEHVEAIRSIVGADAEIWLGGGVRGMADLAESGLLPIAGVLVGSALHSGAVNAESLAALARMTGESSR